LDSGAVRQGSWFLFRQIVGTRRGAARKARRVGARTAVRRLSQDTGPMTAVEIATPSGLARAHLHLAAEPAGALMLGHGAGGGIGARDLTAAMQAALTARFSVALVEQPYRVAGRRTPVAAPQLDGAWIAVADQLRRHELRGLPIIAGGRSAGARVACRTAAETNAVGVLCLAFPLQPPARRSGASAGSRLAELDAVRVPVLVVAGQRDPFGIPPRGPRRTVVTVAGNHSLTTDLDAVAEAVRTWLVRRRRYLR
jgi:predicted alpha/beta-hydrolase family hydrolase